MPLHLLGKKSWNVYNAENIARVKKDEAENAAREEAEEQRMQEADAEQRMRLLRGEDDLAHQVPAPRQDEQSSRPRHATEDPSRPKKRRRLHGEDDTERDLRYAQEDLTSKSSSKELQITSKKTSNAPLQDSKGNIDLFPLPPPQRAQKNPEAEREKRKKETEFEDQYTMRFSNAAGFKQDIGGKPWYHKLGEEPVGGESIGKDVWGNEDPGRKQRERLRAAADDPLAAIQQGVAGVREVEKERRRWVEEKQREIRELDDEETRKRRRRREERHRQRSEHHSDRHHRRHHGLDRSRGRSRRRSCERGHRAYDERKRKSN